VQVELDEEQFSGGSAYLLAAVLERFLGLYASMNSFTILDARTRQRRRPMRVWPPRSGWKALL
jgi:type VI secretion system protein ImpG